MEIGVHIVCLTGMKPLNNFLVKHSHVSRKVYNSIHLYYAKPEQNRCTLAFLTKAWCRLSHWSLQKRDNQIHTRRHHMKTFSSLLVVCAGNLTDHRWIPLTKVRDARSFDVLVDLRLNKRLSKQSWGWWFETPSRSLWRHCNNLVFPHHSHQINTIKLRAEAGIVLCLCPANERRRYIVTSSLIGWAHAQDSPCRRRVYTRYD